MLHVNLPAQPASPQRLGILGLVVGGAELINGTVRLIINKKKVNVENMTNTTETNVSSRTNLTEEEKANREAELKKLLAPSQLFEIINAETNKKQNNLPLMSVVSNTNKRTPLIINNTNKAIINILIPTNQNFRPPVSPGTNKSPKTASTNNKP